MSDVSCLHFKNWLISLTCVRRAAITESISITVCPIYSWGFQFHAPHTSLVMQKSHFARTFLSHSSKMFNVAMHWIARKTVKKPHFSSRLLTFLDNSEKVRMELYFYGFIVHGT